MLKFCGENRETGLVVLGIGLTRENCERLLQGQPIHFTTLSMAGLPAMEVCIIAGEEDSSMAFTMLEHGAGQEETPPLDKEVD